MKILQSNKLKGLVSLVTGGASGLGKETTQYLVKQGGRVVVCDLPESKGQEVVNSIGKNALFAPCDVTSEEDVINALSLCEKTFGPLRLAVNCAGMSRTFKIANPLRGNVMKFEEMEIVLKSNLYGTFNVTRLAAQMMHKNEVNSEGQRGVIINVGSLSSEDGCIGQSAFSAAKGAITAMTLPIARELAPLGIRVLTISPGLFDTPLTSEITLTNTVQEYLREQILFPKRFGTPLEFARMVETVVNNPILNGENIKINGGLRFHVVVRVPIGVVLPHPAEKKF